MTTLGWIFMSVSLLVVWLGTFWCFRKVLSVPSDRDASVSGDER